jgi:hypothetical protein
MTIRRIFSILVFSLFVTAPLSAQFIRGEVEFVTSGEYWVAFPGYPRAPICCGDIGVYKIVPYWADQFLIPAPNVVVFHDGHTVSFWDGTSMLLTDPRAPYSNIFSDDAHLTEIAPMRSGHFLVAEARIDRGAKLIEFDTRKKIAEMPFDGAAHIELLSDQCTLLYTNGDLRVRRMNICTGEAASDFATLLPGEAAGSVRQMPNGHVLVAAGTGIVEFQADGSFWTYDAFAGVTHVALTPDGASFWAGSRNAQLWLVDPRTTTAAAVDLSYPGPLPIDVKDLVVVGEWRASMTPARARGARHR